MSVAHRLCLFILAAAPAVASYAAPPARGSVTLHGHTFTVEVARTPAEWTHGLMDRASMPRDHGMLFVFPQATPQTFWMKDTLIPLDILFFDNARRLVTILKDVPPCRADPCPEYPSGAPARYVLELNAGAAAWAGARKGDIITFSGTAASTQ